MSVTEADSSVLQPLSNGDNTVTPVIHNETYDTSIESKENVHPKEKLNAAEPVGKFNEIDNEKLDSLTSEVDNAVSVNIQAHVESIIPPDTVLNVNPDTKVHATDVALSLFEGTTIGALNDIVVEEQVTSSIENVLQESKDVDSNEQLAAVEEETRTKAVTEESSDVITIPDVISVLSNAIPPAEVVPPTIEALKEEVPATDSKLEESTSVQCAPESITTASTNAVSEPISTPTEEIALSQVSPVPAKPEAKAELVSKVALPDTISADAETLPIATSAVEPIAEDTSTEAVELGIPAPQSIHAVLPTEKEATQVEAASNAIETLPVAATITEEVLANSPVVDAVEVATEASVAEDSAEATPVLEIASSVEPVTAVIPGFEKTSSSDEPSMTPSIETILVAPSEEAMTAKESIVEPGTAAESTVELADESVADPVTSTEVEASEEAAASVPEPIVKKSEPVDDMVISYEPGQPVGAEVIVPASEDTSVSVEAPVLVKEEFTVAPLEVSVADALHAEPATELSAGIPVQEVAVAESSPADVDTPAPTDVPIGIQEPLADKEKVVAEEEVAEPSVREVEEPAKEEIAEVVTTEFVEPIGSKVVPEDDSIAPIVKEEPVPIVDVNVSSEPTEPIAVEVHGAVSEDTPVIEDPAPILVDEELTARAELSEANAQPDDAEPATEFSAQVPSAPAADVHVPIEVLPQVEEPVLVEEKAVEKTVAETIVPEAAEKVDGVAEFVEPSASSEVVPEEVPIATVVEDPVPIVDVNVSSELTELVAVEASDDTSLTEESVPVPVDEESTLSEADDQTTDAESTTVLSMEASADINVPTEVFQVEEPAPVEGKTVVEEVVAESSVPEAVEEIVEVVTPEFVEPSASEVVSEEVPIVSASEVQDVALTTSEHTETTIEHGMVDAPNELSQVSQQASTAAEPVVDSENTSEAYSSEVSQDVGPTAVEEPSIAEIAEVPASNEVPPSKEVSLLEVITAEESAEKDVDSSDVPPTLDNPEPVAEQPRSAEQPLVEAPTPGDTSEGPALADQNDRHITITEIASSQVEGETPATEIPISIQEVVTPVLSKDTQVFTVATSEEPSIVEPPVVAVEERSAEPMEVSVLASEESFETLDELVESNDEIIRADGPDQEPVLSEEAGAEQQEVVPVVEQIPATPVPVTEEPISDPEPAESKDDHLATEQSEVTSTIEKAASTSVMEALLAEEAAVDQTISEAAVEESASAPVAEISAEHEKILATVEEGSVTEQMETAVNYDEVKSIEDNPVAESNTSEEVTPVPVPDVVSVEKESVAEQVQFDPVVEESPSSETVVEAAIEVFDSVSGAETVVDKHKEIPSVVGESDEDAAEGAISAEIVAEEDTDTTLPVTTAATIKEAPTEEPVLSQDQVEAVVATIPSIVEPGNVGDVEVRSEAVISKSVVEVAEPKEIAREDAGIDVRATIERPKSPWMPSFQVTTVGRGVSSDEQLTEPGAAEPIDSFAQPVTETAKELHSVEESPAAVLVTANAEEIVEQPAISPQLVIDNSPLVEPIEAHESFEAPAEQPRPWTPSYSVHSQGSLSPDNVEPEVEVQEPTEHPCVPLDSVHSQGSPLPIQANLVEEPTVEGDGSFEENEDEAVELEDMKFADNQDAPAIVSSVALDQQGQSQVSIIASNEQQAELVPLTSDEKNILESAGPSAELVPDSRHTEVKDSPEANAVSGEQNEPASVLQVKDDVKDSLAETASPDVDTEAPQLVLDTSKDVSAISESLVPHVEERPASPWVASYSVVVQGSPAQEHSNPLDKEAATVTEPGVLNPEDAIQTEVAVVHQMEAPDANETEIRDHEVPPTIEIAQAVAVAETIEETFEDSTVNEIPTVSASLMGDDRVEELSIAPTIVTESFTDPGNQERLKTPGISADEPELNKLESPFPPIQQDMDSQKMSPDNKEEVPLAAVEVVERTVNNVVDTIEQFPITEPLVEQSKKPDLRLTTSNEHTTSDDSPASPDTVPPATGRSRLESTASSRFFPGAWFSPSKTVDESRAFLEVAKGEFTPKKLATVRNPSIDEGPSMAEEPVESQGESQPTFKERKSRWCVIM